MHGKMWCPFLPLYPVILSTTQATLKPRVVLGSSLCSALQEARLDCRAQPSHRGAQRAPRAPGMNGPCVWGFLAGVRRSFTHLLEEGIMKIPVTLYTDTSLWVSPVGGGLLPRWPVGAGSVARARPLTSDVSGLNSVDFGLCESCELGVTAEPTLWEVSGRVSCTSRVLVCPAGTFHVENGTIKYYFKASNHVSK